MLFVHNEHYYVYAKQRIQEFSALEIAVSSDDHYVRIVLVKPLKKKIVKFKYE